MFVRDASGTWRLQQKLLPHEVRDGDFFGWSVALDGDFAVVGAPGDDRNTSGAPDAASADRGAVYAFRCIGDSWQAAKRLQPPGVAAGGAFGASVAIGRGHVLVGAIYGKRVANKWGGLISCGGVWQFEDESGGSGGIKALVSGPAGSLLVIDGNALIKVDRTGTRMVVAGDLVLAEHRDGVGTEARFPSPIDLALVDDRVFVADGRTIRAVDLGTRSVTTVVGRPNSCDHVDGVGTSAGLGPLEGLTHLGGGALLVSELHWLRRIGADFRVTTIAGT